MTNEFLQAFKNPNEIWRAKPFWAWNGKLDKDELLRQIDIMKEMGFGGFFMHSRTGLVTEYLSDEWFELINLCADYAENIGLEAWLYDEDRWPSGIAGGFVTENPKYRAKYLRLNIAEGRNFVWHNEIIAAFSVKLDGINASNIIRLDEKSCNLNESIIYFTVEEMASRSFYNGFTYVDTMQKEATEKFLQYTHIKYVEKCGNRLGKSIKGIFTDEPNRGLLMSFFEGHNSDENYIVPYTELLFKEFYNNFGYDLIERLPELFLIVDGKNISQVKWHFVELLQRLYIENFAKPIYDWCNDNNMVLTGHVLHEDSLSSQTQCFGSVMRAYEYMGYPGIDILAQENYNFWVAKQAQSVANQLSKKFVLSELYGCTGWQMTFSDYKNVGDWQALFGVNLRCPHLSWYTMEGEAKRDYPASILHQAGWQNEYKQVEDYYARIGVVTDGQRQCNLLVINPIESVWCQIYPEWAKVLTAKSKRIVEIEKTYEELFHMLNNICVDFDYADEDMLYRLACVKNEKEPQIQFGQAKYTTILVCGLDTIRKSTLNIIEEFIKVGGNVIFAGETPKYEDALLSNRPMELAKKSHSIDFNEKDLENTLIRCVGKKIEISLANREMANNIWVQQYKEQSNDIYFFLNIDRKIYKKDIKIKIYRKNIAYENIKLLDCLNGEVKAIDYKKESDYFEIITDFEMGGELLLLIEETKIQIAENKAYKRLLENEQKLFGPYNYCIKDKNICVLDFANWRINNGEWFGEEEILKIDINAREKFNLPLRGGEMIQPWFSEKFNKENGQNVGSFEMLFEFYIEKIPNELVFALESPENFKIKINDCDLEKKVLGRWIDICYKTILIKKEMLCIGKNTISLICDFNNKTNPETCFLLGEFGVKLDGNKKSIINLPKKIDVGDLTNQGFPFYSGEVEYNISLPNFCKENEFNIKLGSFDAACATINTSKQSKQISFAPFEADFEQGSDLLKISLFITRRNTFGPLHQVPLYSYNYGPFSFVAGGNDYSLVPSGLKSEPIISLIKKEV